MRSSLDILRRPRLVPALGLVAGILLASCGETAGPAGTDAAFVEVSPGTLALEAGESQLLWVVVRDGERNVLPNVPVRFESDFPGVAEVSEEGLVTARAIGLATVQVWVPGGPEATVPVAVRAVADTVIVTPSGGTLRQGETLQLTVSVRDSLGAELPGAPVSFWSTVNMSVTDLGLVRAIGGVGEGRVWVTSGQAATLSRITVEAVPEAIVLDKDHFTLFPGQSGTLTARVRDVTGGWLFALPELTSGDASLVRVAPHPNHGQFVVSAESGTGLVLVTASYPGLAPVAVPVMVLEPAAVPHREQVGVGSVAAAIGRSGRMVLGAGSGLYAGQLPGTGFTPLATGLGPATVVALDTAEAVAYANAFLGGGRLSIIDVATGVRLQPESPTLNGGVFDLAVHPGTGQVYASTPWGVYRLSPDSLRVLASGSGHGGGYLAADFPRNRVYLADLYREKLLEFDATDLVVQRELPLPGVAQDMAVSADGTHLFVARVGQPLLVLDLASGGTVASLQAASHGRHVALSADGARLAVTTSIGGVHLVDVPGLAVIRSWNLGGTPGRPAFAPDGELLVVPNADGWVDFLTP